MGCYQQVATRWSQARLSRPTRSGKHDPEQLIQQLLGEGDAKPVSCNVQLTDFGRCTCDDRTALSPAAWRPNTVSTLWMASGAALEVTSQPCLF